MTRILENGIPVGNWEDKYTTKNVVAKYLVALFLRSVAELVHLVKEDIASITEIGCGEGYLTRHLNSLNITKNIKGCDFSRQIIDVAVKNVNDPSVKLYAKDIYAVDKWDEADLVVCCEVLEHLKFPQEALKRLSRIANKYCLLSVPNEPVWRTINVCRGKYLKDWGNTPGHINHWNSSSFIKLVSGYFDIMVLRKPLPWIMAFCKKRQNIV